MFKKQITIEVGCLIPRMWDEKAIEKEIAHVIAMPYGNFRSAKLVGHTEWVEVESKFQESEDKDVCKICGKIKGFHYDGNCEKEGEFVPSEEGGARTH